MKRVIGIITIMALLGVLPTGIFYCTLEQPYAFEAVCLFYGGLILVCAVSAFLAWCFD